MSEQNIKYCPSCGTKIDSDAQFCFACGSQFDEDVSVKPEKEKISTAPGTRDIASKVAQKREQVSAKLAEKREVKKEHVALKKEKKEAKKTYKKGLIVGIIMSCLIFGVVGFFVVGIFTSGTYQETFTYTYNPASPASVEQCTIYADTASINVQYNSTPVSYYAKVEVNLRITGMFQSGKTFQNFFNPISWENASSAALSLTKNPLSLIDPTQWFKIENNVITLTLRTDIVYDITATSITGGVSMTVPENVTVNDLTLSCVTGGVSVYGTNANFTQGLSSSTTTGGVLLNFTKCAFGDNIAGTTTTGGVILNMYNAEYAQNIVWTLATTTGSITMNIQQYTDMGADVTGTANAVTGGIAAIYKDSGANTGARFVGRTTTGVVSRTATGYDADIGTEKLKTCTSSDFGIATNTYDMTLTTTTGNINIGGDNN
jgi:hypothetical protein